MTYELGERARSILIGDLFVPDDPSPSEEIRLRRDDAVPALIELNVNYPGGLRTVTSWFFDQLWRPLFARWRPDPLPSTTTPQQGADHPVPDGLRRVSPKLYQCVLTRSQLRELVLRDHQVATGPTAIFKIWPDYELRPQIDRSAPTVKADAAWRSYSALGRRVVWAVIDSGIEARHLHFAKLELSAERAHGAGGGAWVDGGPAGGSPLAGRTTGLHRDFRELVYLKDAPEIGPESPLTDELGHGTHVAGIIAGRSPDLPPAEIPVAASDELVGGAGFVPREHANELSGMAPECELVSLKVLRLNAQGQYVTSSAALIAALDYLRREVNVDPALLRVHGVNMSLGCPWNATHYAAGQSPLSQAVNQLVDSGVVVVISAGNSGAGHSQDSTQPVAVMGSITEPAHAENCIAVGSTHRDAPHTFGVTWTSSKGPTLDGRMKPDVVAPGEWITSAAAGRILSKAGLPVPPPGSEPYVAYAEQSGTSMAAPHVSGVIAAFLSARPEFIGRPRAVKKLLTDCATDLGRERYAQGAGLVDLMRMLSNV